MIQQLHLPIPLMTPKGFALAHLVLDYGIDMDLQFVCFLVKDGTCWTFRNQDIILVENETMGRLRDTSKGAGKL